MRVFSTFIRSRFRSSSLFFVLVCVFLFASETFAQHKGINFQAVIKRPDGTFPNATGVTVTVQILDPVSDCVLREEQHSGVNISNGYVNLVVGGALATTPPGKNPSPVLSIQQVLNNSKPLSGLNCVDQGNHIITANQTYVPQATDARRMRLRMNIAGDDIAADFNMRASPFAVNSEMLNGKTESDFASINSGQGVTQNNIESIFNRYTKLDSILNNFNSSGTSLGANITGNAATATTATNVSGVIAIANGGTGASSALGARTNLGLGPLATMTTSGTADATTYLRGDGTWTAVSGGGAVDSVAGRTGIITLTASDITDFNTAADARITSVVGGWKNANNGIAGLDGSGKIPSSLLNLTSFDIPNITVDKITNAATKYFDYKPNNVACGNNEILKYSTGTGWVCASAATGTVTSVTAAATAGNPLSVSGSSAHKHRSPSGDKFSKWLSEIIGLDNLQ